ncbi:MAG TPA: TonB-dependent receptor, partial [Gemmatimonadaceae bacterium]|nr:TonB-dependent receptor [Gemmatimonadaceae bacterium]
MPRSATGRHWFLVVLVTAAVARPVTAQRPRPDSLARDSAAVRLAPIGVSATRSGLPRDRVPGATAVVDDAEIARGRATLGLDEALALVPGVYVANRYNFSLDQRISIRGFGARSAFAVRGITVLLDGIPQTLPDGQGQLTNLELGETDRIEVLRGSSSALFGNAAGGVISIRTDPVPPARATESVRVTGGGSGPNVDRSWNKWLSTTRWRLGDGVAQFTASRLRYAGARQHSTADLRQLNAHLVLPTAGGWTLSALIDAADDPRADNPGSLTAAELAANPDSASPIYLSTHAGKSVTQLQAGVTLHRAFDHGAQASFTLFALTRDLQNPQTFAYIDLRRRAYGARGSFTRPLTLGAWRQTLTGGLDAQWQRDDRANFGNAAGAPTATRSLDQLEHVASIGPFVQDAVDLAPRTTLVVGTRYDQVRFRVHDRLVTPTNPDDSGDRLMHALSGSAGLTVRAADAATLYANVGTSFETPTTTELANRPDTAGGFNAALDPQTATNYEVGLRGAAGRRLAYSLALYQAAVRGELVAFEEPSSPGRSFYRNAGRSRHRGLEFGARLAMGAASSVTVNWTASDFRYTRYLVGARDLAGRQLPGVPPQWLDLVAHVAPAPGRGAWADVELQHASGYLVDDTLDTRTHPWTTAALRVGWDGVLGGTRASPFVAVNNLFDRRYVSSVVINAARGRYYEPAPGRTLSLGLSLTFGS